MKHDELTVGEVRAMYFDDTALRLPPVRLYRMDVKGDRNYFSVNDSGEPEFYSGVTMVTGRMIPKDEFLVKWIAEKGYDEAIAYRDERAHYGTLMHTLAAEFIINRTIALDLFDSYVAAYCRRERLSVNEARWSDDLRQDMVGLAKFIKDYNVRPLAVELSLCSPEDGIAGTVDLPCLMDIPTEGDWGEKYKSGVNKDKVKLTKRPVTFACVVDFKSGRSYQGGDYNAAQLRCYERLLIHNFPDIFDLISEPVDNDAPPILCEGEYINMKITPEGTRTYQHPTQMQVRTFNWSPKDWRAAPGYHLTEQTQNFSTGEAELMIDWWRAKCERAPIEEKTKVFFKGVLSMDEDLEGNYTTKTVQELAAERIIEYPADPADPDKATGGEPRDIELWQYLTLDEIIKDESDEV